MSHALDVTMPGGKDYHPIASPENFRLFELIKSLKTNFWTEHSVKISAKKIISNRFTIALKKTAIGQNAGQKLLNICAQIGMPSSQLVLFRQTLPKMSFVYFGFEEKEQTRIYKVYTEFKVDLKTVPYQTKPFFGAVGFKWDAFNKDNHVITKYTCYPCLTIDQMIEKAGNIFTGTSQVVPFAITRDFLKLISTKLDSQDILYLDVVDENLPRRSFDINVYDADLQIKDLSAMLKKILLHFSIHDQLSQDLYDRMRDMPFGHLAGGIDRNGKDFFTIYFGYKEHKSAPDSELHARSHSLQSGRCNKTEGICSR